MIFQDNRLRVFSDLFFQESEEPTLGYEWISAEAFDYSVESLKQVDNFLLRVRDEHASQDEWTRMILRCGAYVGEVIRQNSRVVDYHWLSYEDAADVNASIVQFGKSLSTIFALYQAPEILYFPLARIEKFLKSGSENSVFAFAEVALSQDALASSSNVAEFLYRKAQQQWMEAIDLSVYDDGRIIGGTVPILESALKSDPKHVPSLTLLSELMIMAQDYEKAKDLVRKIRLIEPGNKIHETKEHLLESLNLSDFDDKFQLKSWVLEKWETVDCWV